MSTPIEIGLTIKANLHAVHHGSWDECSAAARAIAESVDSREAYFGVAGTLAIIAAADLTRSVPRSFDGFYAFEIVGNDLQRQAVAAIVARANNDQHQLSALIAPYAQGTNLSASAEFLSELMHLVRLFHQGCPGVREGRQ